MIRKIIIFIVAVFMMFGCSQNVSLENDAKEYPELIEKVEAVLAIYEKTGQRINYNGSQTDDNKLTASYQVEDCKLSITVNNNGLKYIEFSDEGYTTEHTSVFNSLLEASYEIKEFQLSSFKVNKLGELQTKYGVHNLKGTLVQTTKTTCKIYAHSEENLTEYYTLMDNQTPYKELSAVGYDIGTASQSAFKQEIKDGYLQKGYYLDFDKEEFLIRFSEEEYTYNWETHIGEGQGYSYDFDTKEYSHSPSSQTKENNQYAKYLLGVQEIFNNELKKAKLTVEDLEG